MFTPQVILLTVLLFFVLVTIHEWGHFYFAKRAGILVREFAIGFGPKLYSFRRGETRYTLRMLPLGGYVRMAGEDPELIQINPGQTIAVALEGDRVVRLYLDQLEQRQDVVTGVAEAIDLEKDLFVELSFEDRTVRYKVDPKAMLVARGKETQIAPLNRQFGSKTVGQRALAIFAGPFMNFILAYVLFLAFMFMTGIPTNVKLGTVEPDSAALRDGLKVNDVILNVNGEQIGSDRAKLITMIQQSAGQPMNWIIERDRQQMQITVTPNDLDGVGYVGFRTDADFRKPTAVEAVTDSASTMVLVTEQIMIGFKMLVLGQFSLDDLGGPVRIVEITGEHASAGMNQYVFWGAILSLYLGIFNLLPIPALDGSRLLFLGLEAVRGKPVDPSRESMVHFIGFAMLMLLMIAVTYNDILRLFKG